MSKALEVFGLKKSYKKGFIPKTREVLKGLDFSLGKASITGFLGANGAGKTTTIKCILGLTFSNAGQIRFFDGQPLSSAIKSKVGFLPERPYFYEYLTGYEFLRFYGELSGGMSRNALNDRISELLKKVDLLPARDVKLRNYSKGMLQKVGLAQALIHRPELVILDEPKAGLDPDGRYYMSEIIKDLAAQGTTVFFSSHLLHDAEKLCENLVIIKSGLVIFEGPTRKLLQRVNSEIEVVFQKEGKLQSQKVASDKELQTQLKELLSQGLMIQEVRRQQPSLEEAFVNLALRDEAGGA